MRRTLQTTELGLKWLIKSGVPVEVDAMWQENSDEPCDTGSNLRIMAREFPDFDFSDVDPVYPSKSAATPYAFTQAANKARGEACLRSLYQKPERVIAVISHSAFLRTAITGRKFANADYRVFTFGKCEKGNLELWEDRETERKGGGMGRSEKGIWDVRDWDFPPAMDGERVLGAIEEEDGYVDADSFVDAVDNNDGFDHKN